MILKFSFFIFALITFSAPLHAQETAPGDACTAGQTNYVSSAGGPETTGIHRLMRCNGANWVGLQTNDLNGTEFPSAFRVTGDISPASIAANQNNYAPTGYATAAVMRLTASAAYNITGLVGGVDGRIVTLTNIGSNTITLTNQDAASTAANRFAFAGNISLAGSQSAVLLYDSTSSRWRAMSLYGSAVAAAAGADREIQFNNAGVFGSSANLKYISTGELELYYYNSDTAVTDREGLSVYMDVAPGAAQTAGKISAGISGGMGVIAGNTQQIRKVRGVSGFAANYGTGAIEALEGTIGYAFNSGNASITALLGTYGGTNISNGTVQDMYSLLAGQTITGGTVANAVGLKIEQLATGGTITNRYGILIESPTGTAANEWAIYQDGGQNNYLGGGLVLGGIISPASIGASQNNYAPTGIFTAATVRLTASAAYNITGIPGAVGGKMLILMNVGSFTITLVDESASSSVANRFALTGNIALLPDMALTLIYDDTSSRWRRLE